MAILNKEETVYQRHSKHQNNKFKPQNLLSTLCKALYNKAYEKLALTKEEVELKHKKEELELAVSFHSTLCEELKEKEQALARERKDLLSLFNLNPHLLIAENALLENEAASALVKANYLKHMEATTSALTELLELSGVTVNG